MRKMAENNYSKSIRDIEADIENKKQQLRNSYLSLKQQIGVPTTLLGGLASGLLVGYFISKRKRSGSKKRPNAPHLKKHAMRWGMLDLVSLFNALKYVGSFFPQTGNAPRPPSQTPPKTSE